MLRCRSPAIRHGVADRNIPEQSRARRRDGQACPRRHQRAIQDSDGNVKMPVTNKFMISVEGSADAASKVAYAQAILIAKLKL
jgi:hypothetical protein